MLHILLCLAITSPLQQPNSTVAASRFPGPRCLPRWNKLDGFNMTCTRIKGLESVPGGVSWHCEIHLKQHVTSWCDGEQRPLGDTEVKSKNCLSTRAKQFLIHLHRSNIIWNALILTACLKWPLLRGSRNKEFYQRHYGFNPRHFYLWSREHQE